MGRKEDRYLGDLLKGEPLSPEDEAELCREAGDKTPSGFGSITAFGSTIGTKDGAVQRRKRRKRRRKVPPIEEVLAKPITFHKAVPTWPDEFHWAIVRHCRKQVTSNAAVGLELLPKATGLLGRLNNQCIDVQLECCRAAGCRLTGRLDLAEQILLEELGQAAECWACDADLSRRLSAVLMSQGRFPEALGRLDHSIEMYRDRSDPGHDLEGNGLASALIGKGMVLFGCGQVAQSIEVVSEALEVIDPRVSPTWHRQATYNLAVALAHSKRADDFALAVKHLGSQLPFYGRLRKPTQERAKFYWLTGKIVYRLGSTNQGISFVRRGRDDLLELRMPQALMAATSDLARMDASRSDIKDLMLDFTKDVDGKVLPKSWVPKRFYGLIEEIIQSCIQRDSAGDLEVLIRELRERAGGAGIMPCLVE